MSCKGKRDFIEVVLLSLSTGGNESCKKDFDLSSATWSTSQYLDKLESSSLTLAKIARLSAVSYKRIKWKIQITFEKGNLKCLQEIFCKKKYLITVLNSDTIKEV